MNRKIYSSLKEFSAQNEKLGLNMPLTENVEALKKNYKIKGKTVPNRLVCQAMEGCDGTTDGKPDQLTKRRYKRLAEGGAGIIWFEATAVMQEGRANPRQLYINEKNLDDFKKQVEDIKETSVKANGYEPIVIMQTTHSGRYSKPFGTPAPLIAYNNPIFEENNPISSDAIVSDEYLDKVGEALVNGAALAQKAGFDGADIKCCHRYLNSELLSAFNRKGRYGGSFENRTRLIRQSVEGAMQNCSGDFIVTTRLNAYDGFPYPYGFGVSKEGGLDFEPDEAIKLVKQLRDYGMEIINITMGNPYFNPHVNRPFAAGGYSPQEHPLEGVARMLNGTALIKEQLPDIAIISSALSYLGTAAPNVAAAYIENGAFDFAGFGRTIFAYPDFARDIIKNGCMQTEKLCICCSKCTEIMRAGSTPGCVIRDKDVYLPIYKEVCSK